MKFKTFKRKFVGGSGPFTAPLLWVGEAPGSYEESRGTPFVGYTGRVIRKMLTSAGIDSEHEVRYDNVIPWNVYIPSNPAQRAALIQDHLDHLDTSLTRTRYKVVIACGNLAFERLLGLSNINKHHGAIYEVKRGDLHPQDPSPEDKVILIPCVHPASVMDTKMWAAMLSISRVVDRAARYMRGDLVFNPEPLSIVVNPAPHDLLEAFVDADEVVIDTEFDPTSNIPFMIGMKNGQGGPIYSLNTPLEIYEDVLNQIFSRAELRKIAHFVSAEIGSLLALGIKVSRHGWYDTMVAFNTLYPDLPKSLSYMARFYLDDVTEWKSMAHDNPEYNALDVEYTSRCYRILEEELQESGQAQLMRHEVIPVTPLMWALQERGLPVSPEAQSKLAVTYTEEEDHLTCEIIEDVQEIFARRSSPLRLRLKDLEQAMAKLDVTDLLCEVHPAYTGLRKKRYAKDEACTCPTVYEGASSRRELYASHTKERTKLKAKLKRWDTGFDPKNNDHLRWLLYNQDGLKLPPQRNNNSLTADATAVQKLLSLKTVRSKRGVPELLIKIKRVQHLAKVKSTFLYPPVDEYNVAHPQYRLGGAGTGRPASGDDPATSDRGTSRYTFNALNIPKEVRGIFVPRATQGEHQ